MLRPNEVRLGRPRWWFTALVAVVLTWAWSYAGTVYLDRGRVLVIAGDPADIAGCLGGGNRMDPDDQAKISILLSTRAGWYMLQRELHHPAYDYWERRWAGFEVGRCDVSPGIVWLFAAPLWTLALPVIVGLALTVSLDRRRRRRVAAGRCLRCDYDLRGAPGRCPECGTLPA